MEKWSCYLWGTAGSGCIALNIHFYCTSYALLYFFLSPRRSEREHKNTGMVWRDKCIAIYSCVAGADLQVEFAEGKVIIVAICKESWSSGLDCVT